MKREQSRAGSRFAECENSRLKAKILITLALLITAVTGAWAQEEVLLTTVTATGHTAYSQSPDGIVTVTLDNIDSYHYTYGWLNSGSVTVEAAQGYTITRCVFKQNPSSTPNRVLVDDQAPFTATMVEVNNGEYYNVYAATSHGDAIGDDFMNGISTIEVYGTAEPPIKVTPVAEPAANTKQWTFTMPGSDIVLTPLYAPAAQWAKDKEVDQIPAAIEGIFAGTTDAIVKAGIVAMMGKTENPQGIVMYAVTSTNQATAPELSAFSATVPTAENIADEGADVLIWYYIQGANTPDGEEATAENTFNDSEICTTPIKVTVLTNKFDITFNAANANTIEAGKATVTVGGTAATVTEGKLQGVKMGSEVKMTANTGYKFRKVVVKKGGAAPAPAKPEYADNAEELPANTKLYMRTDLVYNGDWTWSPTYTAEQAQAVANYYAAITGTKCAVIYGHGSGTDIYYVTSDNGVSGTVYRNNNLTDKFPGYKVYLLK